MAIETRCHGCGKRLRVGEQFAGREARCPECGYVYRVPDAPPAASGTGTSSGEQPLSGPQPAMSSSATETPRNSSTASTVPATTSPAGGSLPQSPAGDDLWHMRTPEGQIYGPVARAELDEWVRQGRVSDECQLRRGEHGLWEGAAVVYPHVATARAHTQPNTGGTYAGPYAVPRTNLNYGGHGADNRYVRPHRGGLILTFAILGWFVTCPVFSVMAWSMGTTDMNQMRTGLMDESGQGITQAGQILGMIHTCLFLLFFGLFFLLVLCGIAADAA